MSVCTYNTEVRGRLGRESMSVCTYNTEVKGDDTAMNLGVYVLIILR